IWRSLSEVSWKMVIKVLKSWPISGSLNDFMQRWNLEMNKKIGKNLMFRHLRREAMAKLDLILIPMKTGPVWTMPLIWGCVMVFLLLNRNYRNTEFTPVLLFFHQTPELKIKVLTD